MITKKVNVAITQTEQVKQFCPVSISVELEIVLEPADIGNAAAIIKGASKQAKKSIKQIFKDEYQYDV